MADQTLAVRFPASSPYGKFFMIEFVPGPGFDQAMLESFAHGCLTCTENGIVTLANGIRAVLIAGQGATTVMWLQNGAMIKVVGPSSSFASDRAIAAANEGLAPALRGHLAMPEGAS